MSKSSGSWLLGYSSILKGIDCGICAGKVPVASRHKWANFPALLDDVAPGVDERRPMSATCHHLRRCAEHPNRKDRTILVARSQTLNRKGSGVTTSNPVAAALQGTMGRGRCNRFVAENVAAGHRSVVACGVRLDDG